MHSFITLLISVLCIHGLHFSSLAGKRYFFIIDGVPTQRGDLPFMVSLQTRLDFHVCGGSLITERAILTAAHCFYTVSPIKAVAGVSNLADNYRKQVRYISHVNIHPRFQRGSLYDVAVVKVSNPFQFSPSVHEVGLGNLQFQDSKWIEGKVAGWGITDENKQLSYSSILLTAHLKILSPERCYEECGDDAKEGLICAFPLHNNEDACQGDSGGPLLHFDKLIGIISAGLGCGSGDLPGIYTNVSYFHDWIIQCSF